MAVSRDDRTDWFKSIQVKGDFAPATMDGYFATVQQWLKEDMEFLRAPIVTWRGRSTWTRAIAFLALVAGVFLPLPLFDSIKGGPSGIEMGYVAVLAGGLVLLADQVFAISSSWMRLTMAEMQVKQVRYRLDFEWAKRRPLLTAENATAEGPALIDVLKTATDACHEIMEMQKQAWTSELRQGMETLRSRLDDDRIALQRLRTERQQEQAKPKTGAVNITVDKPGDLKGPLTVKVGGEEKLKLETVPAKLSVNAVPAGLQTISLSAARADGKPFAYMVTEDIAAGEVKSIAVAVS
jgi:hypothetical protein